jgi:hypothetical protein
MIIGINGKIGSGKDTVGRIIQYLTSESGNSNSSRHRTYEEFLKRGGGSNLRNFDQHYVSDWEIKKFAGKLKTIASLLTGIPIEKFEDQEFKKTYLGEEWNSPYNIPFSGPDFVEHDGGMTVRTLLQKLGTEAMRDGLHENVWVNALFADYRIIPAKFEDLKEGEDILTKEWEYPNWIITDMRFPNEMKAVKERKGITIRVVREHDIKVQHSGDPDDFHIEKFDNTNPKHVALKLGQLLNLHPSETALDDAEFDYEIINDGTIEDLIEKVKEILIKENII